MHERGGSNRSLIALWCRCFVTFSFYLLWWFSPHFASSSAYQSIAACHRGLRGDHCGYALRGSGECGPRLMRCSAAQYTCHRVEVQAEHSRGLNRHTWSGPPPLYLRTVSTCCAYEQRISVSQKASKRSLWQLCTLNRCLLWANQSAEEINGVYVHPF